MTSVRVDGIEIAIAKQESVLTLLADLSGLTGRPEEELMEAGYLASIPMYLVARKTPGVVAGRMSAAQARKGVV